MSMVVPYFSPEGQKNAARHDESMLDKLLEERGQKTMSPKARLDDLLSLFDAHDPIFMAMTMKS